MNISLSSVTKATIIGFAVIGIYKTSKKQALASLYTVKSIGSEASSYVVKHYRNHYKKL